MADFTATFEAGNNGNTITTAGGEASLTAWSVVHGTPAYDNAQASHGVLAAKFPGTTQPHDLVWNLASVTDHYVRLYFYSTGVPGTGNYPALVTTYGGTDGSGNPHAALTIDQDGKFRVYDKLFTHSQVSSGTIATSQWIRFEIHFVHSATAGQVEAKYFATASSSVATETVTSPSNWDTGTDGQSIKFGQFAAGLWNQTFWLDDIVANATTWPGPVASTATTAISFVSGVGW